MAATFIPLSTTLRLAQQTRGAVDQLRDVRDRLRKLKEIFDTQVDIAPDPDSYTVIETQLGLANGEGVTVYNLVAGAYAAVDVAAVQNLIARVG